MSHEENPGSAHAVAEPERPVPDSADRQASDRTTAGAGTVTDPGHQGGSNTGPLAVLLARLSQWVPPGRASRRFLLVSFIDSIGTGLFLAGSALFFTKALGMTTNQVGIGLSLSGIAGLLGMVPIGRLADRLGGRQVLVGLHVWRGLGFLAYPFVQGPTSFFVIAFLIGIAEWSIGPIVQAVAGAIEEGDSRVRTMAAMAAIRNVGFTLGAVLATVVISTGEVHIYSGLVLADAITFFIAAAMLARLPVAAVVSTVSQRAVGAGRVRDLRFLALTALNGLLYLHSIVLTVGLPLWIATRTAAPEWVVGAVLVVNTAIAILCQVPLSRGADDPRRAAQRQHWAGWCLAACCLLVAVTGDVGWVAAAALVLAATVALTLGEIWQSIGAWGLSYALSPLPQRGVYLSVYNLGLTGATIVGPALITVAVIQTGTLGWLSLAVVFALAGLAVTLVARGAQPVPNDAEVKVG